MITWRVKLLSATYFSCLALVILTIPGIFMEGQDELTKPIPFMVVLGGGIEGERLQVACKLFSEGHGRGGVVLTGGNQENLIRDRASYMRNCGIPEATLSDWPDTANSFEEMSAIKGALQVRPNAEALVVSDALHMPRLRYLRERLELTDKVFFQESRLKPHMNLRYMYQAIIFWLREPLAYCYYRLRH